MEAHCVYLDRTGGGWASKAASAPIQLRAQALEEGSPYSPQALLSARVSKCSLKPCG